MKALWIGILIVAIIALIAIFEYNPGSDVDSDTNTPGSGSQNEQVEEGMPVPGSEEEEMIVTEEITLDELSAHDSKNDCWIAYDGKVYDITTWLPIHPGTSAAIEPYCGTSEEFTQAFEGKHGKSKVSLLKQRGTLEGDLI